MAREKRAAIRKNKPELIGWVGIMRVAVLMSCRYQKARDLMLEGAFGKPYYTDEEGLWVEEKKVIAYKEALNTKEKTRG